MMPLEQIAEAALGILVREIANRVESEAAQRLTEEMVLEKLKLRMEAQKLLDERRAKL